MATQGERTMTTTLTAPQTLLTNSGISAARVVAWVRSHRLYATLLGGTDLHWQQDRDHKLGRLADSADYLEVIAILQATAKNLPGGLPFGGGWHAGEETLAACHTAAREAAREILVNLADAIDAEHAAHLAGFAPHVAPLYAGHYTRAWRPVS